MKKYGVILFTFILALVLTIMPMPDWFQYLRPDWLLMVMLYWVMALPERFGIFIAFCCGLVLDVTLSSYLGQHALAFIVCVFFMSKLYQGIRVLPEFQQSVTLLFFFVAYKVMLLWQYGITKQAPNSIFYFFLSALTSAILWPWLFILLREVRRKFIHIAV